MGMWYDVFVNIETIQVKVSPILKRANVRRAAIFGSVARGEATKESDIDFLVEMPRPYTLFSLLNVKNDLEDALQRSVDVVEYGTVKPILRERITKDAVSIL